MSTKERLAAALREAGLADMAEQAEQGRYDDFDSLSPTPITDLVTALREVGTPAALVLAQRAIDGDFDGTKEEGDAWFEREGRRYFPEFRGVAGKRTDRSADIERGHRA